MSRFRKIAVAGAGAVGGVIAWHLAKAGLDPLIIARKESAALLSREGLTLTPPDGGPQTVTIKASSDAAAAGAQDILITGLKAHDLRPALPLIKPLIGPETLIVPLLNGIPWWYFQGTSGPHAGRAVESVDPGGELAAALPARQVAGAAVYLGGARPRPNVIDWNGRKMLKLGTAAGLPASEVRAVCGLLRGAGLDAEAVPDIRREVWLKLAGNAAHNPLSVAAQAAIGHLLADPDLRALARTMMGEVLAVCSACGFPRLFDVDERLNAPAPRADFKTSMLQDYEAGRPPELGAISYAIIEIARLHGLEAPSIAAVAALASEKARRRAAGNA